MTDGIMCASCVTYETDAFCLNVNLFHIEKLEDRNNLNRGSTIMHMPVESTCPYA